jgi:hypothetical protein
MACAEHWRAVRRLLNEHRHELASVAGQCYPGATRVGTTPLLCLPQWIPGSPLPLDKVTLRWAEHAAAPAVDGRGPVSEHVRPCLATGQRYPAYADAMAAVDPPAVFENRPVYRLLTADLRGDAGNLTLARGWYFDSVNIWEALAHELAAIWRPGLAAPPAGRLPLRQAVGEPCDLSRRCAPPAITTVTLRRTPSGEMSFLLHWRDPAKVTHAGGLYQVMPVGVFQPVDDTADAEQNDFSLWRSMVREFSEEVLGLSEDYSDRGTPLDYDRWAFHRAMSSARAAGKLGVCCLGVGVDPLTLAVDILTVAVFDSDVFDALFSGQVTVNAEGRVISEPGASGVPFTRDAVARFTDGAEPMQAAGAAALQLAWRHRSSLPG